MSTGLHHVVSIYNWRTGGKNEAFKIYRKYKISTHPYMKKTDTSPRKTELQTNVSRQNCYSKNGKLINKTLY